MELKPVHVVTGVLIASTVGLIWYAKRAAASAPETVATNDSEVLALIASVRRVSSAPPAPKVEASQYSSPTWFAEAGLKYPVLTSDGIVGLHAALKDFGGVVLHDPADGPVASTLLMTNPAPANTSSKPAGYDALLATIETDSIAIADQGDVLAMSRGMFKSDSPFYATVVKLKDLNQLYANPPPAMPWARPAANRGVIIAAPGMNLRPSA
jgi:hypothetical protein